MNTPDSLRNSDNISKEEAELLRIEEELVETLKNVRQSENMSQSALADICGVKQPLIARLEAGKHFPQIDTLLKILMPLGYTIKIVPSEGRQKDVPKGGDTEKVTAPAPKKPSKEAVMQKPKETLPPKDTKKEEPRRLPIRLL